MKINKELRVNIIILFLVAMFEFLGDLVGKNASQTDFFSVIKFFTVSILLVKLLIYYLNYTICVPKFLAQKKYFTYFLSSIGLVVLFAFTRFILEEIIIFNLTGYHNYVYKQLNSVFFSQYLYDSFYYTLRILIISGVVALIYRNNENRNKIHQLEIENQQAQLATLKSQISPHFLFNTLNNFYVDLIDDKPETANDILKISNLMRYVTYETSDDFVPLSKEINFIKDYLHFYKRRYEDNLQIQFSINGKVKNQHIPTLILIHFIENVCKHGIINDKNRSAKIGINISETHLEILTENHINTSEKYMETGIGTENIKKRLHVIFEDNYTLTNEKNNSIFKSYLKIPMK